MATTGIGSLPFTDDAVTFRVVSEHDLPFVPERIQANPQERLLERTLAGFVAGQPDLSTVSRSLELTEGGLLKTQLCGPTTLSSYGGLTPSDALRWSAEVARATVARVRAAGRECLLFIDEPALATHAALELAPVIDAARGAIAVGVHCCGNTDWERVLAWPVELISVDVRLSLDAVLEPQQAWTRFVSRGGALALGVIPTSEDPTFRLEDACGAIEASLRSTTRDFEKVLSRCLLTTACGLGQSSERYAHEALAQVRRAQALLRRKGQLI